MYLNLIWVGLSWRLNGLRAQATGNCIEEVISKFAQLTPQERTKRKLESLEALKRTFKKLGHDVNVHEFLGASCWMNIDRRKSIEHYGKNQLLPIECTTTQFHCGIQLPLVMGGDNSLQEADSMSWLPDKDNQQTILPVDSRFLPHREMVGLLPDYSNCFFEFVKQEDQKRSIPGEQVEQLEQQGDGCLGFQQIGEEYSYPTPFGTTLGMEKDHEKKIKTGMEWNNLQQQQQQDPSSMFDPTASSSVCFQIPPDQPMFATDLHYHQNWVSGSMFGQTSYNQQLN
uniref:MADS-box domain-containing protein n=1 Tax=Brassica oleracea var. oleracea TaxID=109376 RepID=A0A0D3CBC2_BRAOL